MADEGLKKVNGSLFQDWDRILTGDLNAELVILGSSRGVVGYDPLIIEKITGLNSFNLSFDAGSYNLQHIKLKEYFKQNKKPTIIIQNIDLTHLIKSTDVPNTYQFLPFLKNNKLRHELQIIDKNFGKHFYIPLEKYNDNSILLAKGVLSFFGFKYSIYPTNKGFISYEKEFKRDINNLSRLRNLKNETSQIEKYKEGLSYTRWLITEEIDPKTQIIFVWAPEYQDRLELTSSIRSQVITEIKLLTADLPNVYFFDFSDDEISRDPYFFYDTFHLNKQGATLFSEKLSFEIKKILTKQECLVNFIE